MIAQSKLEGVYLQDLLFDAQQCVEKSLKALLIQRGVEFPYTHDLNRLIAQIEQDGQEVPEFVWDAVRLTRFAVAERYPGVLPEISPEDFDERIEIARQVFVWADKIVQATLSKPTSD